MTDMTTPPPTDEGLLPCPFCGEPGVGIVQPYDEYDVICSVPGCHITGPPRNSLVDAVKAWNTRTPDPARDARIRADVLAEVEGVLDEHETECDSGGEIYIINRFRESLRALAKPTELRPGAGETGDGT